MCRKPVKLTNSSPLNLGITVSTLMYVLWFMTSHFCPTSNGKCAPKHTFDEDDVIAFGINLQVPFKILSLCQHAIRFQSTFVIAIQYR